ncbi:MAG: Rieske 2Fe-2S domain-containing protein [Candidatus Hydrogenedentes bacterium]|nr:Rieske 2Fe-2S domain-containing protein [Candidatus Hydrogenedentota bacterium]
MARMTKPRVLPEASARVRIGKADELPPGTTRIMNEHNIRVTSTREGIAATSLICTHLGCVVKESPDGFACPCHGSKFDVTGKVVSGPAPRALPWLSVSQAADGTLIVDRKVEVPSGTYYEIA